MKDKKLAECSPKKGIKALLTHDIFKINNVSAELINIWNIIATTSDNHLATNIRGTKEAVTRLAQEAFGFDPNNPAWQVVPSEKVIESVIDAKDLLDDLNIPGIPLYQKES